MTRARTKISTIQRETECLDMRLAGMSYRQIGAALKPPVTPQRVFIIVERALSRKHADSADQLREIELLSLAELKRALWPVAVPKPGTQMSVEARKLQQAFALRCLQISDRVAKLAGLDAPIKFVPTETTQEKADRLADELAAYQAGVADTLAMAAERKTEEAESE